MTGRRKNPERAGRTGAARFLFAVMLLAAGPTAGEPLRMDALLGLPDRLTIDVQHRLRFEHLGDQFRPVLDRNDDILLLRTLVHARLRIVDWLTVGGEFQDSRGLAGENRGFISTAIVNPAELLQAYAELGFDDVSGGRMKVRGGRITMDVGKRRFVARNRFRNTINSFTGVDASWQRDDLKLRGFWTLPIQRKPYLPEDLRDNHIRFDRESTHYQFWGLFAGTKLPWGDGAELYVFGLHSNQDLDPPRRKRNLYTPGFRVFRAAAPGRFDYEIETALQVGRSRQATSGAGTLDHLAHFHHAELGYTFDAAWSPRLVVQYDYASGDDDPTDGDNERFDTLFGARRFDFGPTSIYGAFARSNLNTPGLRLQVKPTKTVSAFASFRSFWLAKKRGVWAGGLNQDRGGGSGRYVGSQLEFRAVWDVLPKNVRLEAGYAHLFAGGFMDDAPTSPSRGDADYVYSQITFGY